jgi:two-component system sensor histidine kinase SenX3
LIGFVVGLAVGLAAGGGCARLVTGRAGSTQIAAAEHKAARARAALHAADMGVVVCDADGGVVLRNPIAEAFHEARHAEPAAQRALDEAIAEALAGRDVDRELQLAGPPRRALSIRARPLRVPETGSSPERAQRTGLAGAVAFLVDVTDVRRVESLRRDFVANVTHELKTPIGALELLAETIVTADDAEVTRRLADRMVREAERLSHIVDDLLDLSLAEGGEGSERELVPVATVVNDAIARVQIVADARRIPVSAEVVPDAWVIECDRRQVTGAIANLLDNAVKYSDNGAPVSVTVVDDGSGRFGIRVADRGIGIPSRELDRVFERFYRVDRARSRDTGGTGLGLSIVRHVVQSHGGEVQVESREGEGSTFTLWFCAASAAARRAS